MTKMKVTYLDGTEVEINAGPRAEVELERKFNISAAKMDRNEHFYFMAWAALKYSGQDPTEFDEFLEKIEDVDNVDEPEERKGAGPTRPARRRRTSST